VPTNNVGIRKRGTCKSTIKDKADFNTKHGHRRRLTEMKMMVGDHPKSVEDEHSTKMHPRTPPLWVRRRTYPVIRAIWVLLVSSEIWTIGFDSKDMI
jgi:hypothetical protein